MTPKGSYLVVLVLVLAGASLAACSGPTSADGRLTTGTWSGEHIRLDVTAFGAAAEYDCARGTIDEPIVPDANGRFAVAGTHTFEHGGPIRIDEPSNRHPARYDGRVTAKRMEMTVTVTDTQQALGSFTMIFGAAPRLLKCL